MSIALSQNSFIVRLEDRADISQSLQSRSSSSLRLKKIIQTPMNIILVEGDNNLTERDVQKELSSQYKIIAIQKNRKLKNRTSPNDSLYAKQWQYYNNGINSGNGLSGADIGAQSAWDITTGGTTSNGKEIVVAVIDDGVSLSHPDLVDNLWKNKLEIPNNKVDDDGNGYIDDVNGWNVINDNDKVDSDASHGSPVAGIIGAKGNNGLGVTGVNWNVKIMPVYYGTATEANALASYAYVFNQRKLYNDSQGKKGAFIVATNASWGVDGGKAEEAPLWCAMYDSLGSIGVLNAAATANQNVNVEIEGDLPTSCTSEYLIAVTNINKLNQKANAAFGSKSIDLAAYGDGVFTITKTNYNTFNGTSAAAPHVAGAIALMYAVNCDYIDSLTLLSPAQAALAVKDLLVNNVTPNPIYNSITTTEGVLNLNKAVKAVQSQCGPCVAIAGIKSTIEDRRNLKVEWLKASGQKQIRYKKSDSDEWIHSLFSINDDIVIPNLEFCTEYIYQVRQMCGSDTTAWGQSKYVTTNGCCAPPTKTSYAILDKNIVVEGVPGIQYLMYYTNNTGKTDTQFFTSKTTLSQLIDCSEYSFSLAEFCPVQGIYSNQSAPVKQSSFCGECSRTYCPSGTYDNTSEWIEEVVINGRGNSTGRTTNGYGVHIGSYIPEVKHGDSISLSIRPGYKGSSFREHYSVYVDWNSNGDFTSGENVFQTKDPQNGSINLKFDIPSTAKFGLTRMRVIMSYTGNQSGCLGNSEYGETEDYCINILNEVNSSELIKEDAISFWPNPTSDCINIKSEIKIDQLAIFDYLGRTVYRKSDAIGVGVSSLCLDLIPGIYMINFAHKGSNQIKKLIVE